MKVGATSEAECEKVKVETHSSSHRLWITFNLDSDLIECGIVSIQIVDKVNGGATSMITPKALPRPCDGKFLGREEFAVPDRTFVGGKDPMAQYPLMLRSSDPDDPLPTVQITVRPGQTFQFGIHVLLGEKESMDEYATEISTPCGCSSNTNPTDACIYSVRGAVVESSEVSGDDVAEPVDCATEDDVTNDGIAYRTTATGSPGGFTAKQSFGLVRFQWTDYSLCEEAYSFSREVTGNSGPSGMQTFVEDAFFAGNTECGEKVNIPTVFDDLWYANEQKEKWGQERNYCIRAVSKSAVGGEGYASVPVCNKVVVAWEAAIQGQVLSRRGNVPIAGVSVTWSIKNGKGLVIKESEVEATSDEDGRFVLHIFDEDADGNTPDARTVHLNYWKDSVDGKFHEFWCPGDTLCGGYDNFRPQMVDTTPDRSGTTESCSSKQGFDYITTKAECEQAARILGLLDTRATVWPNSKQPPKYNDALPYGCFYRPPEQFPDVYDTARLTLNPPPANDRDAKKRVGVQGYQSICENVDHPQMVEHTVLAHHLVFDTIVQITDATTLPFGGKVSYPLEAKVLTRDEARAATRRGNNQEAPAWPQEWGAGPRSPLEDAEVCLHAYTESAERIACTFTDAAGHYTLPAVPHTPFIVRIALGSHEPAQFARQKTRGERVEAVIRNQPSLTNDVDLECSDPAAGTDCIEVFRLTPEKEVPTSSGMDYEDQTTRLLNVDVHGTLCKHPLGNMAFVKVAVAGSRQLDMHTALDLPTSYQTSNLVQLPAQAFDITLDAVEPSYPEATSFTQLGYFHRLRKRTQRVDLSDKPEGEGSPTDNAGDPEQSTQGNSEAAIESSVHSVVFQYHPAPTMDVEFFNGAGTELGDGKIAFQPLTPTMCTHGSAIDVSIAEKKILNGPGQVPGWTLDTGMPIAVAARPLATIKFPQPQEMHATCDWIEGYVSHWSSVGLSRADLHWFKVDAETGELVPKDAATTEYKEFANIVNKTLPLQVKLADLARCAHPEDPKCLVPTTHSTKRTIRTDFSDDDTCSSPQHAGFLNLQTGYKLFDSSADACTEHWARQASARDSKFHAWHLLDWTRDLTSAQRDAWESAGINGDHYARGQEASTSWRQFSKVVLAPTHRQDCF